MGSPPILISGAGIAGPTLAYWLLKRGFSPVLVERAPRFREGGYMIDFWSVGFDVAERMALIPELRTVGYHINQLVFVNSDGSRRSALGRRALDQALGERFLSLQRGDLAHAIYRKLDQGVETIFDDTVIEIRPRDQDVEVAF